MKIPTTVPYLKPALGLVIAYAIVWMALEGGLGRDLILAAGLVVVALGYILVRFVGGRILTPRQFVFLAAGAGILAGVALPLVTIFLMALKTGIHAHGPEYTPGEIAWVWRQLPLWAGVGGLAGLGLGLLAASAKHP